MIWINTMSDQYKNLISSDEYIKYLKSHTDFDGVLEVHKWLGIRYAVYMPYGKFEKEWYYLFLIGSTVKNEALNMMVTMRDYPTILFGSIESKVYK